MSREMGDQRELDWTACQNDGSKQGKKPQILAWVLWSSSAPRKVSSDSLRLEPPVSRGLPSLSSSSPSSSPPLYTLLLLPGLLVGSLAYGAGAANPLESKPLARFGSLRSKSMLAMLFLGGAS